MVIDNNVNHGIEASSLTAQLNNQTHNELQRIALGVPAGDHKPMSGQFLIDSYGYPIGDVMKLDAVFEAADQESELLEIKYGTQNAAEISKHMAVSVNMRQYYRGELRPFVDDLKEDLESISEMYLEPTQLQRNHYISMIKSNVKRCEKCPGGCEFCRYAKYRQINKGV